MNAKQHELITQLAQDLSGITSTLEEFHATAQTIHDIEEENLEAGELSNEDYRSTTVGRRHETLVNDLAWALSQIEQAKGQIEQTVAGYEDTLERAS